MVLVSRSLAPADAPAVSMPPAVAAADAEGPVTATHRKQRFTFVAVSSAETLQVLEACVGADVLVPHMGLTTKGSIGADTALTLEESAKRVQAMHDAAVAVKPDILVLCHGGPIAEPEDAQYIFDHTEGVVGFFGASSVERLPTEGAIEGQARKFKSLNFG